jgi:hypothetical protein
MMCPACGVAALHGLIDVNGRAYCSCEECRLRIFGLSLRGVASVRFLGRLLETEAVRKAWANEILGAVHQATTPLQVRESDAQTTAAPVVPTSEPKGVK